MTLITKILKFQFFFRLQLHGFKQQSQNNHATLDSGRWLLESESSREMSADDFRIFGNETRDTPKKCHEKFCT